MSWAWFNIVLIIGIWYYRILIIRKEVLLNPITEKRIESEMTVKEPMRQKKYRAALVLNGRPIEISSALSCLRPGGLLLRKNISAL